MTETEGMLNTRTGEYDFIGRSIPYSHKMIWMSQQERKLSGMICTKFFGRDMVYTLRVNFQDNQGAVQFRNGSNEAAHLIKNKAG